MKNQYAWVGIAVGVCIAGIGIGYTIFLNTYQPDVIMDTKSHGGPVTDYVSLIDELRKSSANVDPTGTIDQPFFSVVGQTILVNRENVQVFEYLTQEEANEDASNVSPDGHSIGLSMPLWVESPHFYKKEKIIVLYVGDDPLTIELLESVVGIQFAGR